MGETAESSVAEGMGGDDWAALAEDKGTTLMEAEGLLMASAIANEGLAMACWIAESGFVKAEDSESTAAGIEETLLAA